MFLIRKLIINFPSLVILDVYPTDKSTQRIEHNLQYTKAVISKPAPVFAGTAVVNGEFKTISLQDYIGKYVVFFFYPLDFTFVCPTEILAFSDRIEEFRKINTEVIAASVDSHFTHLSWIKTDRKAGGLGNIAIPLLSDLTHKISKDYGVYLEDLGHTLRGLFIIDDKQVLRQITMNDLPVGRSVDETLRSAILISFPRLIADNDFLLDFQISSSFPIHRYTR